jgi:hypothetical protein
MQTLSLKVENNCNEVTIREGKALDLVHPEVVNIEGDINSISSFLNIRSGGGHSSQLVDASKVIVFVDKKDLTIKLLLDPENRFGAKITGKLEKSDELTPFFINQNKTFTKEELVKLIKFNKIFFDDPAKHAEMLLAFQKVSSTVNMRANESSDDRGNKERAFVKEVTSNAPTEFILNIPIFKGFTPTRFRVEVCLDVTEGSARFWFESIELHELIQVQRDQIFEDQLKACQGFVIINR